MQEKGEKKIRCTSSQTKYVKTFFMETKSKRETNNSSGDDDEDQFKAKLLDVSYMPRNDTSANFLIQTFYYIRDLYYIVFTLYRYGICVYIYIVHYP